MAYSLSYRPTSILGILGDPPFGISIMAYCGLHMVYIWFTYGLSILGSQFWANSQRCLWQKSQPALEHPILWGTEWI